MISIKELDFLMGVAHLAAARSTARRLQVGAAITDAKGNLASVGYNGTVRGYHTNNCEMEVYPDQKELRNPYQDPPKKPSTLKTDERITIHAEQNALMHAARRGVPVDGGLAVVTHSPCAKCTSLMIQAGIVQVVYRDKHSSFDEVQTLLGRYIKLTQREDYV